MATITKKQFLADVAKEVEALKEHATTAEKNNLNRNSFDPETINNCIYGQMTGDCESKRAAFLMNKACVRQMVARDGETDGSYLLRGLSIVEAKKFVNGDYNRATWKKKRSGWRNELHRNWEYMSALEGYILMKDSHPENVIAYIKGETDKLVL